MRHWGRHRRPLIIAHRGASADFPENTIAAFRHAEALGADAIELDVMLCGTGEVMVFHDDDLRRLAGRPERIRTAPLALLREVRVAGEPISTLDEVLESLSPSTLVNIELKSPERRGTEYLHAVRDDGLAGAVARVVRAHALGARAIVSSFDPFQLMRFRRLQPDIATGLLYDADLVRVAWLAGHVLPAALHPEASLINARRIAAAHRAGRAVNVWTVDDPREIRFLDTIGVDGIITNRPDVARAVLSGAADEGADSAAG